MKDQRLKLIQGGLSSEIVDFAMDAYYSYVVPELLNPDDSYSRDARELFIAKLIAEYALAYNDLGNFKDEVEESLQCLIKKAILLIPDTVIPE